RNFVSIISDDAYSHTYINLVLNFFLHNRRMECHNQTPDTNITKILRLNFLFLTTFRLQQNRRFLEKNLTINFYPASSSSSSSECQYMTLWERVLINIDNFCGVIHNS